MKKKILVTGGAGYIGSHTVVALHNAGYNAVIVDNFSNSSKTVMQGLEEITGKSIPLYEIDCNDKTAMKAVFEKEGNIEGVIHFAAYKAVGESVKEPLKYYQNNIGSLLVLLELMEQLGVKNLVFSSSCTVYGQPDKLPVTEQTPTKPANSPYGRTKQMCEDILSDLTKGKSPVRSVALRYFNPVGAHESALIGELPNGVPANLIPFVTQTAAGIREQITVFGNDYNTPDGTCIRDYIHVMDLADAHIKAFEYLDSVQETSFYDTINVGTGKGNSVLEVLETFEKVSGQKVNYQIGDRREGDVEQVYANVDKAKKVLNWETKYDLDRSLADAWRWEQKISKK